MIRDGVKVMGLGSNLDPAPSRSRGEVRQEVGVAGEKSQKTKGGSVPTLGEPFKIM